jgi:hypothetical protein
MERRQIEEEIKSYVRAGNNLFYITSIDSMRDGGTGVIYTSYNTYYVDKDSHRLHLSYPTSDKNLVINIPEKVYLLEKLKDFLRRKEERLVRDSNLITQIENNL